MPRDFTWTNADGLTIGYGKRSGETLSGPTSDAVNWQTDGDVYQLRLPDGSVQSLSEAVVVQTITATGTALSGACEYRGFKVRAVSGTVNVVVYDNTSATGTPIHTVNAVSLTGGDGSGGYLWSNGARRINTTGCHVVLSGGGSATVDVMVE